MSTGHPEERRPFDESIDRAWRDGSDEQPPARVDAAILAEARKPRSRFSTWQPLAAAAAVACLAFLLVQLMPRDRSVEQPAPPPASSQPPHTAQKAESSKVTTPPREQDAQPETGIARPSPPAPASLEAARSMPEAADVAMASPQQWAARIASLHASGNIDAAAAELRSFRAAHADADRYLPEELRAWAATIR